MLSLSSAVARLTVQLFVPATVCIYTFNSVLSVRFFPPISSYNVCIVFLRTQTNVFPSYVHYISFDFEQTIVVCHKFIIANERVIHGWTILSLTKSTSETRSTSHRVELFGFVSFHFVSVFFFCFRVYFAWIISQFIRLVPCMNSHALFLSRCLFFPHFC